MSKKFLNFDGERIDLTIANIKNFSHHFERYRFAFNNIDFKVDVLDGACGSGYGAYALSLHDNCKSITGIDISSDAITQAKSLFNSKKLNYFVDNLVSTNFKDQSFDLITSFETIEHLKNIQDAFKEFKRIIKPNGKIILSVPDIDTNKNAGYENKYHFNELSLKDFKKILNSNFTNCEFCFQEANHPKIIQKFISFLGSSLPIYIKNWLKKSSPRHIKIDQDYINLNLHSINSNIKNLSQLNYDKTKRYFWIAVCKV